MTTSATSLAAAIEFICRDMATFLLEKNKAYGNSVGDPINCFCKMDKYEKMGARIDDKISRIARGGTYPGDDDVKDLCGYLLLLMAMRLADEPSQSVGYHAG